MIDTETTQESIVCLSQGDAYSLDRNVPHRLYSSLGASILEVSTFHEDSDSYRVIK